MRTLRIGSPPLATLYLVQLIALDQPCRRASGRDTPGLVVLWGTARSALHGDAIVPDSEIHPTSVFRSSINAWLSTSATSLL